MVRLSYGLSYKLERSSHDQLEIGKRRAGQVQRGGPVRLAIGPGIGDDRELNAQAVLSSDL